MKSAQQAAANWANSQGRATTAYQEGINNYNGDWAGATIRQKAVMQQNFQTALANGSWDRGVQAAASTWKQDTIAKAPNYSTGFTAGASKQATAIGKILQAEANIVGSLPPRGDYQTNVNRATAVMAGLHALKGTLGASS